MNTSGNPAIILFAHGARDPRWREPFDRLQAMLRALRPELAVRLAFLELMEPDLPRAAGELIAQGAAAIRIVPIFFGQGGHLRNDLPLLIDACRKQWPGVNFMLKRAVGENDDVLAAIAAYCLAA